MTLHVIYRATAAVNRKRRPVWFSKWLCLGSLFRAAESVEAGDIDFEFLCDGAMPDAVTSVMASRGTLTLLDRLGNSRSYLHAVDRATRSEFPRTDAVYLLEDDHLHVPEALTRLIAALRAAPDRSYFTLYDHPDRYTNTDDLDPGGPAVELIAGYHWRRVESTNMSYATRVGTLHRDRRIHWASSRAFSYPHDRALWRTLQGLGFRRPLRLLRKRSLLFGPVPSLSTHCEDGVLAPAVDWARDAEATRSWMIGAGLPADDGW